MVSLRQAERNRAGVRRWYGDNRDDYNALRRERYASSPDQREKARLRAAKYRQDQREGLSLVSARNLTRELNGRQVKVFSTGEVAVALCRTPQMLRNWEREGLIPMSIFSDSHRLYTKKQVGLIASLLDTLKRSGGKWGAYRVQQRVDTIWKHWS